MKYKTNLKLSNDSKRYVLSLRIFNKTNLLLIIDDIVYSS